ncbi:ATPase [Thalassobaculum fulvum]|uniref:ATPase n=1 Tax=Thalassobaculum fulvum TaxID=1633335 RepID=A0A918XW44_9PROT|nr:ATP12 family protein [Thalassobaculum fulvum]GHD58946.1 ATPase [Thalassobaculum fulvum]
MKRIYKTVAVAPTDDGAGFSVLLDGRPVRSPGQRPMAVPARALADAIAGEWDAQVEKVDARSMPLTGFAATVIDRVSPQRDFVVTELAGYGGSDLVCYLADDPAELTARQEAVWAPLRDWAEAVFGARLRPTAGIMPVSQDADALAALRREVETVGDWELASLHTLTTVTGSLVLGLAVLHGRLDAAAAYAASEVDEAYQIEKWGMDREAEQRRRARRAEVAEAAKFVELLRAG